MREELVTIVRMLMGMPPAIAGDLPKPDDALVQETETASSTAE
jgi:acetyl-CoA carboxylase carboxyl transferase subunit beta